MTADPVRGVDYPSTYQQLLEWFPDNQSYSDYLARLRWPEGFVCPKCGGSEFWRTGAGLWMCRACGRRTSVTAGTIFDRTRTPLSTWFAAIWFLTSQKNGMSALGLQRVLGFGSYETAWAWMHKLRRAMVRPERDKLSGIVELDETMIGGATRNSGGGYGDKVAVMIAIEHNDTRRLGRVRLAVADHPGTRQLVDFATTVIEPGSTIRTDGARTLRRLAHIGYTHDSPSATPPPTRPASYPACTWSPRCSNAGSSAPCTSASKNNTCPTTSTSTPSGSTAATPSPAGCSSTGSCSRPWTPSHIHSRTSSSRQKPACPTSPKQICRTPVRPGGLS